MPERDLAVDGAGPAPTRDPVRAPARPPRPRLVPVPDPAGETALTAEAAELQHLSEMLVQLLLDWTHRTRDLRLARRAAGLSPVGLSWENEIVDQYASRLGPDGAEIALALLTRSRP
ncbi:hypothetical protein ACN3XK_74075 [Actinomadura welshii]